jgi:CheY-like chemotaxis protein
VATQSPAAAADQAMGKLIVVIDDDTLVLDGMRGILRTWGCSVVTASSDGTALTALAAHPRPPDLIISDYRLGDGKTGFEVIARLRSALGARIPAFLISGDTAPERLREASASGFYLLHKPVLPITLRSTVSQLLKEHDNASHNIGAPGLRELAKVQQPAATPSPTPQPQ